MVEEVRNVYILDHFVDTHPDNLIDHTVNVSIPPELPDRERSFMSQGPIRQYVQGWGQRAYDMWKHCYSKLEPDLTYPMFEIMFVNGSADLRRDIKAQYDEYRDTLIQFYLDIKRLINQVQNATNSVARQSARRRLSYVRTSLFLFDNYHRNRRGIRVTFVRRWKPVRDDDFVYFTTNENRDKHDS